VVRICQLGELEDLATVVAELRGNSGEPAEKRATATARDATRSQPAPSQAIATQSVKKNDERSVTSNSPALAEAFAAATQRPSPAAPTPASPTATNEASEQLIRRDD